MNKEKKLDHLPSDKLRPLWMRSSNELDKKPNVNVLYGKMFYYDGRYNETAISMEFAKNPQKYCTLHPSEYPCYILLKQKSPP